MTKLNKSQLTPFHVAVTHGNTPVVIFYLSGGRKGLSGVFHPGKAAPDGRTPLQLALGLGPGGGNRKPETGMLVMLVKDATVHDVERCWDLWQEKKYTQKAGVIDDELWEEVRGILLTKVRPSFVSYCVLLSACGVSRKGSLRVKNLWMIRSMEVGANL